MRTDEIVDLVQGPAVLDVGCAGHHVQPGHPTWLHGKLRERFRVTGIDVSATNVELMHKLGFDDIHVGVAETFNLDRKFDTIVAGEVVEHMSNVGQFFANAREHLAPGGRIVLSTPYVFSLMYAFYAAKHYPKTCENQEHTCWFCLSTLRELSRREGLEIESSKLIEDFDRTVRSWKYHAYWMLAKTLGRLLPSKLTKTNMIVVLRAAN
jgi:2-polyprenyl-3-methyl-5-hydroxy-6-metoxy-1,4-benzoquinol methylase